jgi:hypothetical protein
VAAGRAVVAGRGDGEAGSVARCGVLLCAAVSCVARGFWPGAAVADGVPVSVGYRDAPGGRGVGGGGAGQVPGQPRVDGGGYHWNGELRLWDNEILMGWYAATEGSVRSKGTIYFALHPHGLQMAGRWVGLGYDDRIMTGWGSMAKTREAAEAVIDRLNSHGGY